MPGMKWKVFSSQLPNSIPFPPPCSARFTIDMRKGGWKRDELFLEEDVGQKKGGPSFTFSLSPMPLCFIGCSRLPLELTPVGKYPQPKMSLFLFVFILSSIYMNELNETNFLPFFSNKCFSVPTSEDVNVLLSP